MVELLTENLPEGFSYPSEFLRIVDLGLVDLEPWWIFDGDLLKIRYEGLRKRFPDRSLVPFARRQDNEVGLSRVLCTGHAY
jgi:hypothetical protein